MLGKEARCGDGYETWGATSSRISKEECFRIWRVAYGRAKTCPRERYCLGVKLFDSGRWIRGARRKVQNVSHRQCESNIFKK